MAVAKGKTLYVDVTHFNAPVVFVFALFLRSSARASCARPHQRRPDDRLHRNALLPPGPLADRLAATLAGITFVTLFAYARFVRIGNYISFCPYSYELPHG